MSVHKSPTAGQTRPWAITVEAVILYSSDPLEWSVRALMNMVAESVDLGYATVHSHELVKAIPFETQIDAAQATLDAFPPPRSPPTGENAQGGPLGHSKHCSLCGLEGVNMRTCETTSEFHLVHRDPIC